MANKKRNITYVNNLSKIGLLVLYFFLLAPQCQGRFYSLANFYRFPSSQKNAHVTATKQTIAATIQSKAKHLNLDKRFRNAQSYKVYLAVAPGNYSPVAYFIPRQQKQFSHTIDIHSDAYVHSLSLRGPPSA